MLSPAPSSPSAGCNQAALPSAALQQSSPARPDTTMPCAKQYVCACAPIDEPGVLAVPCPQEQQRDRHPRRAVAASGSARQVGAPARVVLDRWHQGKPLAVNYTAGDVGRPAAAAAPADAASPDRGFRIVAHWHCCQGQDNTFNPGRDKRMGTAWHTLPSAAASGCKRRVLSTLPASIHSAAPLPHFPPPAFPLPYPRPTRPSDPAARETRVEDRPTLNRVHDKLFKTYREVGGGAGWGGGTYCEVRQGGEGWGGVRQPTHHVPPPPAMQAFVHGLLLSIPHRP